MKRILKIIPY